MSQISNMSMNDLYQNFLHTNNPNFEYRNEIGAVVVEVTVGGSFDACLSPKAQMNSVTS